jgi:hypothetical protein
MIDNNNLIQWGIFEANKTQDNIDIKLKLDDKLLYNKKNNNVIVDLISPPISANQEYIIGWKVGKNVNGEKRIIKLGIPFDAIKLIPIGDDFFASCRKERCNKALVLDIQELNLDEQITVVPRERSAYSYIYSNNNTEYKIGEQIIPDGFNNNNMESCGQGIHFHRDRRAVFKMWIEGFENIKYEY